MPKIATHKCFDFYIKRHDLTHFIVSQYGVVFYLVLFVWACFTHLSSSNLCSNLCLWYYDQLLVLFNKEINADVYRHSLWEYSKCFHCSFEWHLIPHKTLSIETCIRRTPCIKRTLQHSRRCPLNTGFTVFQKVLTNSEGSDFSHL